MFDKDHPRHVFSKIVDIDSVTEDVVNGIPVDIRQSLSTGEQIGIAEYRRGQMARIPATLFENGVETKFEDLGLEMQYLVIEYYQLQERIEQISVLESGIGPEEQHDRQYQAIAMSNYRFALQKRIKRLTGCSITQHLAIS